MAAEESPVDPNLESEEKEALQYWGYLLKDDKCGTEMLNRLLEGIAKYIVCAKPFRRGERWSYHMSDYHLRTGRLSGPESLATRGILPRCRRQL
jgi:hypothetical protein